MPDRLASARSRSSVTPTVYVVDDDASVRTAIARLLESVDLSCELFSSAADFLERVEKGVDGCAILDVRMPGITGLDLQRALATMGAEIPVVFVTAYADVALTVRAMKAGALEVLTKPFDDQALLDVVHAALAKARVRQQERDLMSRLRRLYDSLTPREREVMNFVAAGLPNKRIAAELGTTEGTVKAHRAQVMRKMQVESLADLVRAADRLELPRTNLHQES